MQITYTKHKYHLVLNLVDGDDTLLSIKVYKKEDIKKALQSFDFFVQSLLEITVISQESSEKGDDLEDALLTIIDNAEQNQ